MANGKVGAPVGNKNASRKRPWAHAIENALDKYSKTKKTNALDLLADKLVKAAIDNMDWDAIHEIANRLDGKPRQQIEATGEDGDAIKIEVIDNAAAAARAKVAKLLAKAFVEASP